MGLLVRSRHGGRDREGLTGPMNLLRTFWFSATATIAIMAAVAVGLGPAGLMSALILTVLEITFSFDNAVVNAKLLGRMSPWWQKFFMTFGIFVAVFVVRFALPIFIVALTAGLGFGEVLRLAIDDPVTYGNELHKAAPAIDSFGGVFLIMIAVSYFLDETKDVHWLAVIERRLAFLGRYDNLGILAMLVLAFVLVGTIPGDEERLVVAVAAFAGIALHVGLGVFETFVEDEEDDDEKDDVALTPMSAFETNVLADHDAERRVAWIESELRTIQRLPAQEPVTKPVKVLVGMAAFFMFLRLEVLDASFSFDGVIGAFALSNNVFVIMAGLGAGALWVRSMTVHLVRTGTLAKFRFLEHGAHWAIGVLGVMMLLKLYHVELPEWVIGCTGLVFIAWAVWSSKSHRGRHSASV